MGEEAGEEREREEREQESAARPYPIAKFTELNLSKIWLAAQFSSSPDVIDGTRDVECIIKEEHGRKGDCSDPKEPVMPISVKGRDTLPITLIVPSKNLGFLESEHTQSDLFSTCSPCV